VESLALQPVIVEEQIESDVEDAARALLARAAELREGEVLVAGGEPTVVRRGGGTGGRCIELAVRMAMNWRGAAVNRRGAALQALLGSSDGVDGNSGAAGLAISLPATLDRAAADRELARSNSMAVAELIGEPLMIAAAGNNLRDLYLLARG
jgi:glycerate-2-kinase